MKPISKRVELARGLLISSVLFFSVDGKTQTLSSSPIQSNPQSLFTQPTLTFVSPGPVSSPTMKRVAKITLSDLRRRFQPKRVSFYDPLHRKQKNYEAISLKMVLDSGFGTQWRDSEFSDVAFVGVTGEQSSTKTQILKEDGAFVAISDLDDPTWEPFSVSKEKPGPFYVFWTGQDQASSEEYLFFWKLGSLNLLRFEDLYPKVVPMGATKDSEVYKGFEIFRGQCFKCHSMDRQGSRIGPDMQAPQNILSYRSSDFLKAYIFQPSKFRYTSMPDNTHLSPQELEQLITYFDFQKRRKGQK